MRFPSVAIAPLFFVVAASLASATPANERKSARKSGAAESSTGLAVAGAAESAGAKLLLTAAQNGNGNGNGNGNAGGNSEVPPGRRCDPNDPRPGCQPIKPSPKK
jgi:hypothetical protein